MPSPVFRNPPRLKYCGVTIELSHAGRFDSHELISGSSAYALVDALAGQGVSRYTFDVRTQACTDPYMPGTRVVLLAGNPAKLGHPLAKLGAVRGSPTVGPNGVIFIPTFHPQDCADLKNYEATLNPDSINAADAEADDDDNEGDTHVKDMGRTSRRNYRFWFIHDTHKALDIARNGLRQNKAAYHTHPSAEQIVAALSAARGKELFIDIETDPRSGRMLCFAFSVNASEIWCVPIITHDGKLAYAETSILLILRALAAAFAECTVVAHNSLFDLFILLWRYKIVPPAQMRIRDTMLQHARLHVDTEKSLGHCVSLYTHQPYHKDEGIFCPSNYAQYKQLLEYNAKDVETTALIHAAQWSTEDEGARASMTQANALVRPLLLKSFRGLPTDTGALCKLIDSHHARAAWIEQNVLQPLANNQPCNPRSPKQVAKLLYEDFGLPKSSDPTISLTGKDALYKLALKYPIPALKVILHIRHLSKEAGQISCRLWRNSRITCAYVITGTKTFRLSSRKLLGTFGTNTQNWNKKTRRLIVAPPGYTLVQVDQAGAEALVVAYIAPAGRFRDLFLNGIKSHTYVAVHLFREVWEAELGESISDIINAPIAQVRTQKRWSELEKLIKKSDDNPPSRRYYYLAKQTCHSANYSIRAPRFVANILEKSEGQISLSVSMGERFLSVYHGLFPEIENGFQAYVVAQLQTRKELRNLFGYPRRFYGQVTSDTVKKDAFSWIPQSTVGCITCRADSELQAEIDSNPPETFPYEILQNGHDSLLLLTPLGTEVATAKRARAAMNQRMVNHRGEEFFMRSEATSGPDWYSQEPIKGL